MKRLITRGASFARSLVYVDDDISAGDALLSLLKKGLVRSDSFAPVRYISQPGAKNLKASIRQRVSAIDSGRWEAVRKPREASILDQLNRIFDKYLIVSKETASGSNWTELLSRLRRMEYEGKVRRGYFVNGISGAQFVRESDFDRVTYLLKSPLDEYRIVSAADPAQPYGKILPHMENRAFTRISGSYAVFYSGIPVCVFEKSGENVRIFDDTHAKGAISLFVQSFKAGKILPIHKRVTLKTYPVQHKNLLLDSGFQSDGMYLTLFKI